MTCRSALLAAAALAALLLPGAAPARAGEALDRIVAQKTLKMGIRTDAPPFAYVEEGQLKGFSTELCALMARALVNEEKLDSLNVDLVPVAAGDRFDKLAKGEIDLLCGATTATLSRRETMSFTLPIFSTGTAALIGKSAPGETRALLSMAGALDFRAPGALKALAGAKIGAVADSTSLDWANAVAGRLKQEDPKAKAVQVVTLAGHEEGLAALTSGKIDVYLADRAILGGLLRGKGLPAGAVLSRNAFTYEPYALAIPRGDEELRLILDRALSRIYRSGAVLNLYAKHFGAPPAEVQAFYGMISLPE